MHDRERGSRIVWCKAKFIYFQLIDESFFTSSCFHALEYRSDITKIFIQDRLIRQFKSLGCAVH